MRDYDKAIADETKAIEINPRYVLAYANRGIAYGNKGDYDKAIADETKAIEIDPRYANAYANRGIAYEKLGRKIEAIADYRSTLALSQSNRAAASRRGQFRGRQKYRAHRKIHFGICRARSFRC